MRSHPSIHEIQSMPDFSIYMDYMRKVLGELLGWSCEKVNALVADNLKNPDFRIWFRYVSWSEEVAWHIIRDQMPDWLDEPQAALTVADELVDVIDPSQGSVNTYLHQEAHYDWGAARHRIQHILHGYAKAA
jgi:hypothetical protein